jgi:hypothetical protein
VPLGEPPGRPALWEIIFVAALFLTLTAVALLLSPTANKAAAGQSTNPPPRLAGLYVSAGRVALSLATACTAFLLLGDAAALFGPGPA